MKRIKSAIHIYGNVPVLDLDSDDIEYTENGKYYIDELVRDEKPVISVDDVTMEFHIASNQTSGLKDYIIQFLKRQITYRKLFALYHVSFDVYRGEIVGYFYFVKWPQNMI